MGGPVDRDPFWVYMTREENPLVIVQPQRASSKRFHMHSQPVVSINRTRGRQCGHANLGRNFWGSVDLESTIVSKAHKALYKSNSNLQYSVQGHCSSRVEGCPCHFREPRYILDMIMPG